MGEHTFTRREAIGAPSAASAALAIGCGGSPSGPSAVAEAESSTSTASTVVSTNASCAVTPTETVGPYPSLVDLFRSDIREGKAGTPLSLAIKVLNTNANCAPVAGANVEIWQCDATGNYSQYGSQVGQTYLRGIQTSNVSGEVAFTTVYPGWYQSRATHIHVEVAIGGVSRKVTQMAFPESVSNVVHSGAAYGSRGSNPTTNAGDNVFSDGFASELVSPLGDSSGGYSTVFQVGVPL